MASIDEDSRKLRLLDWLTTPPSERQPQSLGGLAEELGVSRRLLHMWKADPAFRARWEKQAKDIVGEPEKVQRMLEMLYNEALHSEDSLASRVRAADVYLKAVDAIKPPVADEAKKRAAEMSDAELQAALMEAMQHETAKRTAE